MIRGSIISIAILFGAVALARSQNLHVVTDTVNSRILNEPRVIQIFLPPGFDVKKKYDMLYVLDGESFGVNASQILSMEQNFEYAPPMIIVSIFNREIDARHTSSRNRDFLPIAADGYIYSGGADKFFEFLKTELVPLVDQKYPSSGKNILFGHSYGGLFAVYALLTQPGVFQSYIASDPSLWWNDGYVNKLAAKNIAKLTNSNATLYIAGRTGELSRALGSYGLDSILKAKMPAGFKWKNAVYDNERHQAVKVKALYDGLKFTYFGYGPATENGYMTNALIFFPMNGVLLKNKPVRIMTSTTFLDYEPGIRYTTDGTEPMASSPKFEFGTTISAPADLVLTLFATQSANLIFKGHFSEGTTLPASSLPKLAIEGGFNYAYYKGQWKDIPNFDRLKPKKTGLAKVYIGDFISDTTNFACEILGYLKIEREGYYTFFLDADDQAALTIGGHLLINIQADKDNLNEKSFVVPLEKGFYSLKIGYLHKAGDTDLRLTYIPPANDEFFVPPLSFPLKLQYHTLKFSK